MFLLDRSRLKILRKLFDILTAYLTFHATLIISLCLHWIYMFDIYFNINLKFNEKVDLPLGNHFLNDKYKVRIQTFIAYSSIVREYVHTSYRRASRVLALILTCLAERIARILHAIDSWPKLEKAWRRRRRRLTSATEGERKRGQNSRAYPPPFC